MFPFTERSVLAGLPSTSHGVRLYGVVRGCFPQSVEYTFKKKICKWRRPAWQTNSLLRIKNQPPNNAEALGWLLTLGGGGGKKIHSESSGDFSCYCVFCRLWGADAAAEARAEADGRGCGAM